MAISGEDLDSQHSLNSERTFTLSSPSQKLWLSSQETEPDNREDYKMNRETVFCDDIKTEVTYDGDSVILNREVFQQILGKVSAMCDLQKEVSLIRELCFEKFGKRGTPVSDPVEFQALCKQAGAHKIFDAMTDSMSTDRQSNKRKNLNELRAVSVIYTLIYGQSQQANWFQVATARTLKGLGISDKGMETLRHMGLAAHPVTINNACKEASADHLNSVQQTIHDATENEKLIMIYIDDYHNIHSHHRPSTKETTQVIHMATLLMKVFDTKAIPHNQDPINDPIPANTDALKDLLSSKMKVLSKTYVNEMPDWLQTLFFDPESQRHRLLVHDYQQQEIRQLRSMDNCKLVDCIEMPLKSHSNFAAAFQIFLDNGLSTYLEKFIVPFVGDWPAQFYVRQISYTSIQHANNIMSFLGPLHISLNARENVILKFYEVFRDLYAFLFGGKKALAKKPKPWRISFLLEVMYGGWTLVRDEILGAFSHSKEIEFLTFLNLLDNYIPLVLSIYSVIFRNNMPDTYYDSMLRCWMMFLIFGRRHYDKALLIALSNIEYLKSIDHPLLQTIFSSLCAFDEYPVENFHSLLRARTQDTDTAEKINQAAREIDARKHELHDFQTVFVPIRKSGFSERKLTSLKLKSAEFITKKFGAIMANPGQAKCITNQQKKSTKKIQKENQKTRWQLPNLFGPDKIVKSEVLPIGYLSPATSPDPMR